jgi:hypothetical protein
MRQTFSKLISLSQNLAGKDTSTASQTFFKQRINARYEQVMAKLPSHLSEIPRTFSTVDTQQYYHYPPQIRGIKSLTITIGSKDYELDSVVSLKEWNRMNSLDIQAGAIPTHFFKRQRDFGIYPIPQAVYTGTIVYNIRAGGLTRTDYTTGTITATENSQTIEGAGGASWSTATGVVPDMWFSLADTNGESRGSWYRIGSITDTDTLNLESVFEETTIAGSKYIIGECPELPEEGHELLAYGALADYYAGFRQALDKAQSWNNMFFTGDFTKETRDPKLVEGGLIGLIESYTDRDDSQLIRRKINIPENNKIWATHIS